MRLTHDPNFQRELDTVLSNAKTVTRVLWWLHLFVVAAVLTATIFFLERWGVTTGLMVSVTVGVATLCFVAVLNSAVGVLHGSLMAIVGTIEWFEKKQLGEVEEI